MIRLLVTILAAVALTGCSKSEWRTLDVAEGGFVVLMRGDPQYARQSIDTPAGKMDAHLYSSDRPDSFFAVGYSDYPLTFIIAGRSTEILSGVRDTWVRRINGQLGTNNETKLGDHAGLQFTARGNVKGRDSVLEARLYLVDQRLYQLIAIGPAGEISQGLMNRFFDSFKLTETAAVGTIRIDSGAK